MAMQRPGLPCPGCDDALGSADDPPRTLSPCAHTFCGLCVDAILTLEDARCPTCLTIVGGSQATPWLGSDKAPLPSAASSRLNLVATKVRKARAAHFGEDNSLFSKTRASPSRRKMKKPPTGFACKLVPRVLRFVKCCNEKQTSRLRKKRRLTPYGMHLFPIPQHTRARGRQHFPAPSLPWRVFPVLPFKRSRMRWMFDSAKWYWPSSARSRAGPKRWTSKRRC